MKLLPDDRDQYIDGHGAPDLRLHRILAGAEKLLDAQVLLDPLEEQFDLPPAFVKRGDGECGQCCVVGQKHQRLARLGVFEPNAPQVLGVMLAGVKTIQHDALIADHARGPVDSGRVHTAGVHTALGARDEEGPSLMHLVKPGKVQITPIHHLERPRLDRQDVQHLDVVHFAVADVDKGRNCSAQVQQGVQFDSGFGHPKLLGTGHPVHPGIARVAIDYAGKTGPWDKVHDLCEQRLADIHMQSPTEANGGNYTNLTHRVSSRHQMKSAAKPRRH